MDAKRWFIFGIITAILLGGIIWTSQDKKTKVDTVNPKQIIKTEEQAKKDGNTLPDAIYGNKDAKVVFLVYGDFSCPGCRSFAAMEKKVFPDYKDKVAFVFRNFPLTSIHPNSKTAHSYAESIKMHNEDKYWDFYYKIFEQADKWTEASPEERDKYLDETVKSLGLDLDKIKKDINSDAVQKKINFDIAVGKKDGVSATPTIFINGKSIDGKAWESEEALRKTLDEKIKEAEQNSDKK